jgi:uncharacterized protein YciI
MDFLCVLQLKPKYKIPDNWSEETNKILDGHWKRLVKLHGEGKIKFVSRTNYEISNDANRGFAVYTADSETDVRSLVMNDPCIVNDVMEAEIHPLTVFMLGGEIVNQ